jgi:hypothetical protein
LSLFVKRFRKRVTVEKAGDLLNIEFICEELSKELSK